ncbi:GNAT family N-acetyltransferase [Ectothiorhodospiraceae bacterium WFHF3C12]|nr:GNAT family N-acetyltransferase [Ectothiorhodospiraceae bacterium WFHF3C12]
MAEAYPAEVLKLALPAMTRANERLLRSGSFYLAEGGGEVIGCGGWTAERPDDGAVEPGLAHIRHFSTRPDWGRRGVGRRIFEACMAQARGEGIRVFECYASLNAVAFYAALGFRALGERHIALTPKQHITSMQMVREL